MIQENQGQYLSFKNIPNTVTETYRSQVVYTNRNIFSINGNNKQNTDKAKISQLSKQKHVITSKSKGFPQPIIKSPRSNCEVISFSTDSTKKNHLFETPKKNVINGNQTDTNSHLHEEYGKGRLTKAKSDIEILRTLQKSKKEETLSKKLIEEVMQQVPSKYQTDFKKFQNQPNHDMHVSLIETIKLYEVKIDRLQKEIQLKNAKIKELQKHNSQTYKKQCQIQSYLQPENRYFHEENRQNVRRLLNMLQVTDEYKDFAKFALDDNGIVLLAEANKTNKTKIDGQNQQTHKKSIRLHYCSCNKEFIPEPYLWVPESIYEYGREFLKSRQDQTGQINGFLSKSEYELLLYELNKMWREREKRIVNTITHEKNLEIEKLKRKYNINGVDRLNSGRKNTKH